MQTAFSCLLVCLLEFYYRRISREVWLRWFAGVWVAQAAYAACLWVLLMNPHGGPAIRAATALFGYLTPPTIVLVSIALLTGRTPRRRWIAGLYAAGLAISAITLVMSVSYPLDCNVSARIHNVPRHICYALASLYAAAAFAWHARERKLAGSLITSAAWAIFGVVNVVRAWQWAVSTTWSAGVTEVGPDVVLFALVTFIANALVWIVMSIGVGLLLTESAERSERKARAALRELEAAQTERSRLAQLVEQSRDAILVESAGRLRYLNSAAASLMGYTADEVPSLFMKPLAEVCGVDEQDPMRTQMEAAIAATGMWEGQSEWRRRGSSEGIPLLVGAVAMDARGGEEASVGLIARDLRERLRLEEELRLARHQEALGRMAGGVAHDFNNLLTVIMGYASLALNEGLRESLRTKLSEILAASKRAAAITERLRAFGRRQTLRETSFELNALLKSMLGTLNQLVEGDVELSFSLCSQALPVRADASQVEQVVMNLVLNARQAISGTGRIVVRTAMADAAEVPGGGRDFVKIEVEDTGSGIEPEVLEHIFDPYFTTRSTGSGLGLSMAYGIIQQSGGRIQVSSQPGRGSLFRVFLLRSGLSAPPTDAETRPEPAAVTGREEVMVIDDRPEVASFVTDCLVYFGYRVNTFTDCEAALHALHEGKVAPQAVIRDVMMPGMPLKDFADRVQALRPCVGMVFMSGLPEGPAGDLIETTGGHFITKPFAPEQLAALVRRALDSAALAARN